MNSRLILALLLSLSTFLPVVGQTKPADDKDDVVKITTNLVQIDAVVTKNGKPVRDLKLKISRSTKTGASSPSPVSLTFQMFLPLLHPPRPLLRRRRRTKAAPSFRLDQ